MDEDYEANGSVLLVDDEPAVLAVAKRTLKVAGFEGVLTCQDGRDVPDLLRDRNITVVVLDLNMPDLPGLELLSFLQQEFPEVAVIVMTGTDDIETAVECMKSGAFDYIVKPVEGGRLVMRPPCCRARHGCRRSTMRWPLAGRRTRAAAPCRPRLGP